MKGTGIDTTRISSEDSRKLKSKFSIKLVSLVRRISPPTSLQEINILFDDVIVVFMCILRTAFIILSV